MRYLPVFVQDITYAAEYISEKLNNPKAAKRLIDDTEKAIIERLNNPTGYAVYKTTRKREHPYYRINIRNFSVFYVVIDDVMEVRRFIYGKRDLGRML